MKEYLKLDPAVLVARIAKSRFALSFLIAFVATILLLGGLSVSFIKDCIVYKSLQPKVVKKQLEEEAARKEKEEKQKAEQAAAQKRQDEQRAKQKAEEEEAKKRQEEEARIGARKKPQADGGAGAEAPAGGVSGDAYPEQRVDPSAVKPSDGGFSFE